MAEDTVTAVGRANGRARLQDAQTGKMVFPLDERLDRPAGDVTVSLAACAVRLGTFTSLSVLTSRRPSGRS